MACKAGLTEKEFCVKHGVDNSSAIGKLCFWVLGGDSSILEQQIHAAKSVPRIKRILRKKIPSTISPQEAVIRLLAAADVAEHRAKHSLKKFEHRVRRATKKLRLLKQKAALAGLKFLMYKSKNKGGARGVSAKEKKCWGLAILKKGTK